MPKKARVGKEVFMGRLVNQWLQDFPAFGIEGTNERALMYYHGERDDMWLTVVLEGMTRLCVTISPASMFGGASTTLTLEDGETFNDAQRFTVGGVGAARWAFDFSDRARCGRLAVGLGHLAMKHFSGEVLGKCVEQAMKDEFPGASVSRTPNAVTMGFRATQRRYVKVRVEIKINGSVWVVFNPLRVFLPFALDRPGRDNLVWLVMPDGAQFQCEKFSGMLGCELSLLHHKRETLALVRGLARIAEGVAV